jgi:hypothetical protein
LIFFWCQLNGMLCSASTTAKKTRKVSELKIIGRYPPVRPYRSSCTAFPQGTVRAHGRETRRLGNAKVAWWPEACKQVAKRRQSIISARLHEQRDGRAANL